MSSMSAMQSFFHSHNKSKKMGIYIYTDYLIIVAFESVS